MARTARIDLHRRNALRADAFGIDVAGDIAFDDGDVVFVAQRFNTIATLVDVLQNQDSPEGRATRPSP